MQKKIFAPIAGCMLVGLMAYTGYRGCIAYENEGTSDLLLANVEALTDGDINGSNCKLTNQDCRPKITEQDYQILLSKNPSLSGKYKNNRLDLTDFTEIYEYGRGYI